MSLFSFLGFNDEESMLCMLGGEDLLLCPLLQAYRYQPSFVVNSGLLSFYNENCELSIAYLENNSFSSTFFICNSFSNILFHPRLLAVSDFQ